MGERVSPTARTSGSRTEASALQAKTGAASTSIRSPIDRVLFLQRTIGNRAVEQLLTSGALQAKLTVGRSGDVHEQEADRMAEHVMRMPDGGIGEEAPAPMPVQRVCSDCGEELHRQPVEEEEEEKQRGQPEPDEEEILQTKADPGGRHDAGPGVAAQVEGARTAGGQPLPDSLRAFFEPRFGRDFRDVRVHTDARASESARAVNARAYTVGRDLVFREGQYSPETTSGKALLAHELTHVVQQGGGGSVVQRQPADDPNEIQSYVFGGDKKLATDKDFARRSGQDIAARIRKSGKLTRELSLELSGMQAFFQGDAKVAYIAETKPTVEQMAAVALPSAPRDPTSMFEHIFKNPKYIDNNLKQVSFYFAELAKIRYQDGATLDLGLVPKWMEPPFVEVDYRTPPGDYRRFTHAKKGFGFFREEELQGLPRGMTWADIEAILLSPVDFVVEPKSGRIVPTIVNTLTAPELCRILLDSEAQYVALTQQVAYMGEKVATIIGLQGGGNWGKGAGFGLTRRLTATTSLYRTRAAGKLASEMDALLRAGGTKTLTVEGVEFATVQVVKQGRTLSVSRYSIQAAVRGQGRGGVMNAAFEEAAVATARVNGMKTVTIDVGIIVNPGWRVVLESRGYVRTLVSTPTGQVTSWVKTIKL